MKFYIVFALFALITITNGKFFERGYFFNRNKRGNDIIIGFKKNDGIDATEKPYLKCDGSECISITLESGCNANTIGKVFNHETIPALCLNFVKNKAISVDLTEENSGDYILNYSNENVFGITQNHFGIVTVGADSVVLKSESLELLYIYSDDHQRIVNSISDCPVSTIFEFTKSSDLTNQYTLNCEDESNQELCN